ncbi:oligosaccharide flippase family protein [Formosa sediminum]|uniref:Oligosaccharide flippase family protein n=1 Tax=Formosa sediminum TaxID=2594004 RepID=A0A516GNY7_9FLAO|nr:oligosaccharide flippase family protein [Formosa sediminum]QDO93225.1 oligosaccharide flippase family protein [Formosa sediminum]
MTSYLKKNKKILENFSYLTALNLFNVLSPLIIYPYLIRVLEPDNYGLTIFAQTTVAYLVIFVSFGFNVTATKEVSINRDFPEKLNEIVSATFIIKFLLFVSSFLILILLFSLIPKVGNNKVLFILTMWLCFYEFVFPVWYFQGIEKMKYITLFSLISKLISLILIFFLVVKESDYLLVPLFNGIGGIIAGLFSLYIVFKKHKVKLKICSISVLKYHIKDSYLIFISRVSNIKDNTPAFLVGALLGNQALAYYDLAFKIVKVVVSVFNNVTNVVFPVVAMKKDNKWFKKILIVEFFSLIVCYLILVIFRDFIVTLLGSGQMLPASPLIPILGIMVVRPLASLIGSCVLITNGLNKEFTLNLIYSTLFYLVITLACWGAEILDIYTISWGIALAQLFELFHKIYIIKTKKLIHWII